MVSYLCDICFGRYSTKDLADKCNDQVIPKPNIPSETWVRYTDGGSRIYGIVSGHCVNKNSAVEPTPRDEVGIHKLVCKFTSRIKEVASPIDNASQYWDSSYVMEILEERCTVLLPKEVQVIEAISSKVGFKKGVELPSVDFLCQQTDFTQYLK